MIVGRQAARGAWWLVWVLPPSPLCCCFVRKASAVQSAVWTCQSGSFLLFLSDFLGLNCHTWNHWVKRPRKWLRRVVELVHAAPHLPGGGNRPARKKIIFFLSVTPLSCLLRAGPVLGAGATTCTDGHRACVKQRLPSLSAD